MSHKINPPFRADHVGSLLRPEELATARVKWKAGELQASQLRVLEDQCIAEVVRLQEDIGMCAVTDGEYRRDYWHLDFLSGFDGIELWENHQAKSFTSGEQPPLARVTGKVRRTRPIMIEHYDYLHSVTTQTPKISIPGPAMMHLRAGDSVIDSQVYAETAEFWSDLIRGYREEIADLYSAGCRYLQIDDVSFAYLCDDEMRAHVRHRGDDPDVLPSFYADLINRALRDVPADMTVSMHMCRGNFKSTWVAEGGYEPIAEAVLGSTSVDAFFMEYDSDRAGGFGPLRYLPDNKIVVLGLITSKTGALEPPEALKRRIAEAAAVVPLERLCLSPQCGFSSTHHGNALSHDDQWRKLELAVTVANEVWG